MCWTREPRTRSRVQSLRVLAGWDYPDWCTRGFVGCWILGLMIGLGGSPSGPASLEDADIDSVIMTGFVDFLPLPRHRTKLF